MSRRGRVVAALALGATLVACAPPRAPRPPETAEFMFPTAKAGELKLSKSVISERVTIASNGPS